MSVACSRRSDSGVRAKKKASERAGKKRGKTGEEDYLNTWNRLGCLGQVTLKHKQTKSGYTDPVQTAGQLQRNVDVIGSLVPKLRTMFLTTISYLYTPN